MNDHNDELPVGFLAQLVEQCTDTAEVMGSKSLNYLLYCLIWLSYSLPYFFTYKPRPYKLETFQQTRVVQKKAKPSAKPRARFLIVTGHLSERTSRKTLGNGKKRVGEDVNTTTRLQKHNNTQLL